MNAEAIEKMLNEGRSEWEALVTLLDTHPEENLHDPASPPWTSRDVYAHLARWTNYLMDQLDAKLASREFPLLEGTTDEVNIRWQQEDRRISLTEAHERAIQAHERCERTIRTVPPERWNKELESLARIGDGRHYAEHRRYIIVE